MERSTEERIQETVAHGRQNQRTAERIQNWCRHARISRFGGIGMIEQSTGVPIGHMGVECDHAPNIGIQCWDLKESAVDFYLKNCEHCDKREPGVGQDIEPLIKEYKEKEAAKVKNQVNRREMEARRQLSLKQKLDKLRTSGGQEINQIVDFIDAIAQNEDGNPMEKLIEFARLAPETFSEEIINFLKDQFLAGNNKLATTAIRILLILPISPATKRDLAIKACSSHSGHESSATYLETVVEDLSSEDVNAVLHNFTLLALPIGNFGYRAHQSNAKSNTNPLLAIVSHHGEVVKDKLREWLKSGNENYVETALRAIRIIAPQYPTHVKPFLRDVLGKLLRHKILLPGFSDESWKESLAILRRAALSLFRQYPSDVDRLLQSFLECADETARSESAELYTAVFQDQLNEPCSNLAEAQKIAFKRVLWLAVENPDDSRHNLAMQFFFRVSTKHLPIALKHFDEMFGAACMLSNKMESLDQDRFVETPQSGFDELEIYLKRLSLCRLQRNLVSWVFAVCANQDRNSVNCVLDMYTSLPKFQIEMRSSMVENFNELMKEPEYVNLVLPHLYAAMTSSEVKVRGSAVTAIGKVHYDLMRDFPELLFEVYLVLLTDPYVYVHKSAVYALKTNGFPENLKKRLENCLFNLILCYRLEGKDDGFVVECLKHYVNGCLTDTQILGAEGNFVLNTISQLDDCHTYEAIKRIGSNFKDVPSFAKLCVKFIPSDWLSEGDGIEHLFQLLESMPTENVHEAIDEIVEAARSFSNSRPNLAGPLIVILAKLGCWADAVLVCEHMLTVIPKTRQKLGLRLYFESLRQICAFELARPTGEISIREAERNWTTLIKKINEDYAEIDARQSFPPNILSQT